MFLDLESIYTVTNFDVMGPDIVNPYTGKHQNPRREKPITIKELKKDIKLKRFMFNVCKGRQPNKIIYDSWKILKSFLRSKRKIDNNPANTYNEKREFDYKCVLYGACLIFSRKYIEKHDDFFYPGTFLYFEEDFLRHRIDEENGISVYCPNYKILHKENGTTSTLGKNYNEINIIKLDYAIKSGLQLLEHLKK